MFLLDFCHLEYNKNDLCVCRSMCQIWLNYLLGHAQNVMIWQRYFVWICCEYILQVEEKPYVNFILCYSYMIDLSKPSSCAGVSNFRAHCWCEAMSTGENQIAQNRVVLSFLGANLVLTIDINFRHLWGWLQILMPL